MLNCRPCKKSSIFRLPAWCWDLDRFESNLNKMTGWDATVVSVCVRTRNA